MRILHVMSAYAPAYEWGGPIRSAARLLSAMAELGHEVRVTATTLRGHRGLPEILPGRREIDGVQVEYLPALEYGQYFLSGRLAASVYRAVGEVDVTHAQGVWSFPTLVAARICSVRRFPFVLSTRGALEDWSMKERALKKRVYWRLCEGRNVGSADRVHVTAEKERQAVAQLCPSARLVVVPNPVKVGAGLRGAKEGRGSLMRLGMVGRLHAVKGFDVILPALARSGRRDLRLVVVGPDEDGYQASLERLAELEGVRDLIEFRGLLEGDALQQAYQDLDLLLLPSHQENFGNVVAEAAAHGVPAWVSDQVGIMDWVREEKVGEVLPLSVDAWADALAGLDVETLHRCYDPMRLRGAVERHFAPRSVAKQMIAVYEEVLGEYRKNGGRT